MGISFTKPRSGILRTFLSTLVILALQTQVLTAGRYTETFVHLKPVKEDLSAFEVDLYTEDTEYTVSLTETLPVQGIRLVIRTDDPNGLSLESFSKMTEKEYAAVAVRLIVAINPTDPRSPYKALTAGLNCQVVGTAPRYLLKASGLVCFTQYDAGDAGEFFIEPIFDTSGFATDFRVHFRMVSQKVSDMKGTPDGPPFIGALLDGHQYFMEQSVAGFNERFRNARPLLRLKDLTTPLALTFTAYEEPER